MQVSEHLTGKSPGRSSEVPAKCMRGERGERREQGNALWGQIIMTLPKLQTLSETQFPYL